MSKSTIAGWFFLLTCGSACSAAFALWGLEQWPNGLTAVFVWLLYALTSIMATVFVVMLGAAIKDLIVDFNKEINRG